MSKLDIRNRDMNKKISFKYLWMKDQLDKIRMKYSEEELSNEEIFKYLNDKYEKRYKPVGRFMSNVTFENKIMSVEQFINTVINSNEILSGYCTLFMNHGTRNIAANALKYFLDQRKVYKNKMKEYPKGSTLYLYYKVMQLTYKILANSYYGILGLVVSPFFNSFLQNSVTLSGQDIITTAISAIEGLLGDNNKFKNLDDCLEFVMNVKNEEYKQNILDFVEPISKEKLLDYLIGHTVQEFNTDSLEKIINSFDEELVTRIYYKNHLTELLLETKFIEKTKEVLFENNGKYGDDKNHTNDYFRKLVCDFTFYDNILDDRYKRFLKDKRKSSIVTDTDSTFCYMKPQVDAIETAFNLENNRENALNITNLILDIITEALKRICWTLTTNVGIEDTHKEIINFKNEFVYEILITTKNKKNYAGLLAAELGNLIDQAPENRMDIKGLPIRKSVVPKDLREEFTSFLLNEILLKDNINFKELMNKYDDIINKVDNSLRTGETTYLIPANVELYDSYKFPERMQSVRGTIIWNALEPENSIQPPEKVNLIKLKTDVTLARKKDESDESYFERLELEMAKNEAFKYLKDNYPDKYEIVLETIYNKGVPADALSKRIDFSDKGFAIIAIPKDLEQIPEYLVPLIDYDEMVKSNTSAGNTLIGALGIYIDGENNKSNILKL